MNARLEKLTAPEPIKTHHVTAGFDSGEAALDNWLVQRALRSHRDGAARTYVVCTDERIVGSFSLAAGAVMRELAPGKIRRNMPEPIPVMLLARLAVDRQAQGRGLGASLLRDAALRTLQAADIAGIRALVVHAISDDAKHFYKYFGFRESTKEPMTLMATLGDLNNSLPNTPDSPLEPTKKVIKRQIKQ